MPVIYDEATGEVIDAPDVPADLSIQPGVTVTAKRDWKFWLSLAAGVALLYTLFFPSRPRHRRELP